MVFVRYFVDELEEAFCPRAYSWPPRVVVDAVTTAVSVDAVAGTVTEAVMMAELFVVLDSSSSLRTQSANVARNTSVRLTHRHRSRRHHFRHRLRQ